MNAKTMQAQDSVCAALAECYATIEGNRYNFAQVIDLEAKMEPITTDIPILGRTAKAQRTIGWKGTGKATMHYNQSIFRRMLYQFKETGESIYFDIQVTNEDPTAKIGRQTTILKNCCLAGGIIAKFNADGEYLDEEIEFLFDDWEMPEEFSMLSYMM